MFKKNLSLSLALGFFAIVFVMALDIGGMNLALCLLNALLIADSPNLRTRNPFHAALIGLISSLTYIFVIGAVLVPGLSRVSGKSPVFFKTTSVSEAYRIGEFVYQGYYELRQWTSIALAVFPILMLVLLRLYKRLTARPGHLQTAPGWSISIFRRITLPGVAISAPLLLAFSQKNTNKYEYLASTMSGDGRNFFLTIENIRVTAQFTRISEIFGQGNFVPSLAAFFSSGSGVEGRMQVQDQYSVNATYVLLHIVILLALATLVLNQLMPSRAHDTPRSRQLTLLGAPMVLVGAFVISTFGPVVNEVFRSGFFSLYGAMAMVAAFLALESDDPHPVEFISRLMIGVLISVIYPLAIGVVLLLSVRDILKITSRLSVHVRLLLSLVVGVSLMHYRPWSSFFSSLNSKSVRDGAIIPISNDVLVVLLVVALIALILDRTLLWRRYGRLLTLYISAGLLVNYLLQHGRKRAGLQGAGYYGEKNDYLIYFGITFLIVGALLTLVLREFDGLLSRYRGQGRYRVIYQSALSIGFAYLVFQLSHLFVASQTFLRQTYSWSQPSARSTELVLSNWNRSDAIFVNPENPGEARMVNFWLPYFWGDPGWAWVYDSFSSDPSSICGLLQIRPARIITADEVTRRQIGEICGSNVLTE